MKPKNRMYCHFAGRPKMTFETDKEANRFLEFNTLDPEEEWEEGKVPIRSYFCVSCNGWHVTSRETKVSGEADVTRQGEIVDSMISGLKTSRPSAVRAEKINLLSRDAKDLSRKLTELEVDLGKEEKTKEHLDGITMRFTELKTVWDDIWERSKNLEQDETRKIISLDNRMKSVVS